MSASDFKTCLVGAGNMGGAMLSGWLEQLVPDQIVVVDPNPGELVQTLQQKYGFSILDAAPQDPLAIDVMIVAVKPQMMGAVLPGLKNLISEKTVCVSVAAGTSIKTLKDFSGCKAVVRVMPNTPSLVGRGISVACANAATSTIQKQRIDQLMSSVGNIEWVEDEPLIDAVTAVSGSGPAYVFYLAECMAAAGVEHGLSPQLAALLARETIAGAGQMLCELSEPASKLRENVTSPNGTTAAALSVLMDEPGMKAMMSKAIAAAHQRSEELSK